MSTYGLDGTCYIIDEGRALKVFPYNYETGELDEENIITYKNADHEEMEGYFEDPFHLTIDEKRNLAILVGNCSGFKGNVLQLFNYKLGKFLRPEKFNTSVLYLGYGYDFRSTALYEDTLYALADKQLLIIDLSIFKAEPNYSERHNTFIDKDTVKIITLDLGYRHFVKVSPDGKKIFMSALGYFAPNDQYNTYEKVYEQDKNYRGIIYDVETGKQTVLKYSATNGDFSLDSKYLYFLDNKAAIKNTDFANWGTLYRYNISEGTYDELKLENTGCNSNIILSGDGTKAYVQANMSYYTNGRTSQIVTVDISEKEMKEVEINYFYTTASTRLDLAGMLPVSLPTALIAKGYEDYRNITFDYNDMGGTNFTFNFNIEDYDSVTEAATTSNTDYNDWSTTAQTAIDNFSTKVLSPTASSEEYTFGGWYTDSSFTSPADFDAKITENTSYYAQWLHHVHSWGYKAGEKKKADNQTVEKYIRAYCVQTENPEVCEFSGVDKGIDLPLDINIISELKNTVSPNNATMKALEWKSDDPDIVKVDENGHVSAIKTGTTSIHAYAKDGSGISSSCSVVVEPSQIVLMVYPYTYPLYIYRNGKISDSYGLTKFYGKAGDTIEDILSSNLQLADYQKTTIYDYEDVKDNLSATTYVWPDNVEVSVPLDTELEHSQMIYLKYTMQQ